MKKCSLRQSEIIFLSGYIRKYSGSILQTERNYGYEFIIIANLCIMTMTDALP